MSAEPVVARLAAALAAVVPGGAGAVPLAPGTRLWVATVLFGFAGPPPTFTITMDGVNPRTMVPTIAPITVGDVVWVLEQPPMLVIIGPYLATSVITGTPFRIGTSQLGSTFSLGQT